MAGSFTLPTVLANLAAGSQALSLIDGDLTTLRDPLLSLNTFSNFYTDAGAANAYVVTVSSPQTVSQATGLTIQFIAANANTGASTLQVNALAVKNITHIDGTALVAGDIPAGGVVTVTYDGAQYQLQTPFLGTGTSWTPTITFATPGDLNVVYAVQVGRYIKNGRQITAHFSIQTSTFTFTTATGSLLINGFPIASANVANIFFEGSLGYQGITKAGYSQMFVQLANNVTQAQILASGSGQPAAGVVATDMPSGGTVILRGSVSYYT